MARSLAAHAPGRLTRRGGPGASGGRSVRSGPRPSAGVVGLARTLLELAASRRRLRLALIAAAISLPLLGGSWLWLRQSPFVSVEHVRITGVYGADAQAVQAALAQAAHGMSTLDVSDGTLTAAVAPLHVVRELRATPSFPHSLRIEVVEQPPVAVLTVAGVRTAVAADGVALGSTLATGSLPSVTGYRLPPPGGRVGGATLLGELAVLGAAPAVLAAHIERVFSGPKGLTVAMRNGLVVYFGDDSLPHAKWLSLARVLADPSSAGASYVDVRLSSHPAAGFPSGVTPPDASMTTGTTGTAEPTGNSESTIAALAQALSGGSTTSSPTAELPSTSASTPAGAEASQGALAPPASETGGPSGSEASASTTGSPGVTTAGTEAPTMGGEAGAGDGASVPSGG
jgi:cell division protein FtsQ